MDDESCATCARYLHNIPPLYSEKSEKPITQVRRLDCCGRTICGNCIAENSRFATYCPYCQISTKPTPLPQGLRDPPSYTPAEPSQPQPETDCDGDVLPSYSILNSTKPPPEKSIPAEDVLHFIDHENETLLGISLKYNIAIPALRKANNLNSDHLLLARRTMVIPGEHYKGGVSLSPRPLEGEDEEKRKVLVRRWMVACKVSEYDVALLYLKQAEYDLNEAIMAYKDDERWEKEHPIERNVKGKDSQKQNVGRRRFTGQRS